MFARFLARRLAGMLLALSLLVIAVLVVGPRTGAYRTLTILSGSMEPRFGAGDMVITTPAPTSSVRVGDVITYEAPIAGRPVVTHRVVRVVQGGRTPVVVTRGDANAADDPWQARLTGQQIWRQQAVIPHAGRVVRLLRQDVLRSIAVYGIPALLLLLVLIDTWKPASQRAAYEAEDDEYGWDWLDELELQGDEVEPYAVTTLQWTDESWGEARWSEDPLTADSWVDDPRSDDPWPDPAEDAAVA